MTLRSVLAPLRSGASAGRECQVASAFAMTSNYRRANYPHVEKQTQRPENLSWL